MLDKFLVASVRKLGFADKDRRAVAADSENTLKDT